MLLEFTAHQVLISGREKAEILYKNDEFTRMIFQIAPDERVSCSAEILVDAFPKDGIEFLYLSVPVKEGDEVLFTLAGLLSQIDDPAFGTIYSGEGQLPGVWMPKLPLIRQRDRFGRIRNELKCEIIKENEALRVRILEEGLLETSWIAFYRNQEKYFEEIVTRTPWEEKRFTVLGSGGYICCLADFFDYLIGGNLYRLFPAAYGRTSAGEEAYSVFLIAETLATVTGKNLYRILQREIAYSLLLSLDAAGRWRHGSWTDDMETHTRFQVGGINLLLDYYRHTGRQDFLNAAYQAARFLISIAEEVSHGGLWFLHDTLEVAPPDYWLHRRLTAKAFGKSPHNMCVLNTHIDTLSVLLELRKELDSKTDISDAIKRGWPALQDVLQARPAEWLYRGLSRLMDTRVASPSGKLTGTNQFLNKLARYCVSRMLAYSKRVYPRLVMPSGYIDRALSTKGNIDYDYHFVNVWDLIRIYRYQPESWLRRVIDQGIDYCLHRNVSQYAFQAKPNNIELVGEIFQVYAAITPDFERSTLATILLRLKQIGCGVTPGLLGFDRRVVPAKLQIHNLRVRDRDIELINLSNNPGCAEFLVTNSSPDRKQVSCEVQQTNRLQRIHKGSFVMTTSEGQVTMLPEPCFILPPCDYAILQFQYDNLKERL